MEDPSELVDVVDALSIELRLHLVLNLVETVDPVGHLVWKKLFKLIINTLIS